MKNKAAQALGRKSVKANQEKYGITDWSAHMKKVRNGKKIAVKPVSVRNLDKRSS